MSCLKTILVEKYILPVEILHTRKLSDMLEVLYYNVYKRYMIIDFVETLHMRSYILLLDISVLRYSPGHFLF